MDNFDLIGRHWHTSFFGQQIIRVVGLSALGTTVIHNEHSNYVTLCEAATARRLIAEAPERAYMVHLKRRVRGEFFDVVHSIEINAHNDEEALADFRLDVEMAAEWQRKRAKGRK